MTAHGAPPPRRALRALAVLVVGVVVLGAVALAVAPRLLRDRLVAEAARHEVTLHVGRARLTTAGVRFEDVRGQVDAAPGVRFALDAIEARAARWGAWTVRGERLVVAVEGEADVVVAALEQLRARHEKAAGAGDLRFSARAGELVWRRPCGDGSEIVVEGLSVDVTRSSGRAARTSAGGEARVACGAVRWGPGHLSLSADGDGDTLTLTSRSGVRALALSRPRAGALVVRIALDDLAMPRVPGALRDAGVTWPEGARWSLAGELTRTGGATTGAFDARTPPVAVSGVASPGAVEARVDVHRDGDGPWGLRGRLRYGAFAGHFTALLTTASDGRATGPLHVESEPVACATLADIAARRQGPAGALGARVARSLGLDRHVRGSAVLELDAAVDSRALSAAAPTVRLRGDCALSLFR